MQSIFGYDLALHFDVLPYGSKTPLLYVHIFVQELVEEAAHLFAQPVHAPQLGVGP